MRDEIRAAAIPVLADSRLRLSRLQPSPRKTVDGLRIYVRKAGTVSVEQRLRKTTGNRSDWGKTQMRRGLIPALEHEQPAVERRIEQAIDQIADRLNGGL